MKKLIINGDDLGADEGRNAGILEGVRAGMVKSVSLLANGCAFQNVLHEVEEGKYESVSIGIHLNLSEGRPISNGLRILAGDDGAFLGKGRAQRLCLQDEDDDLKEEISREVDSQIALFRKFGIPISHLDGHQHIHVFPAVRKIAVQAAEKYGISWMRIPREPAPKFGQDHEISGNLLSEAESFSALGIETVRFLRGTRIRATDHFRGLYLKGRFSAPVLSQCLENLPRGVTELMVHPGRLQRGVPETPFSNFSTIDRERELDLLLAPSFLDTLRETGVRLTSFLEAQI